MSLWGISFPSLRCKRLLRGNDFHAKLFLTKCKRCKRLPRINFQSEKLLLTTRTELKVLGILHFTIIELSYFVNVKDPPSLQTLTVQNYKIIFSKIYWTIIEHYIFQSQRKGFYKTKAVFTISEGGITIINQETAGPNNTSTCFPWRC